MIAETKNNTQHQLSDKRDRRLSYSHRMQLFCSSTGSIHSVLSFLLCVPLDSPRGAGVERQPQQRQKLYASHTKGK